MKKILADRYSLLFSVVYIFFGQQREVEEKSDFEKWAQKGGLALTAEWKVHLL